MLKTMIAASLNYSTTFIGRDQNKESGLIETRGDVTALVTTRIVRLPLCEVVVFVEISVFFDVEF